MERIRKTVKVFILAVLLFITLTLMLCTLITFTDFDEDWSYAGMVTALTLSTFVLGFLEAEVIGTRGLFVGITAAAVFMVVILVSISLIFGGDVGDLKQYTILSIPILAGGLGGVVGINRNK